MASSTQEQALRTSTQEENPKSVAGPPCTQDQTISPSTKNENLKTTASSASTQDESKRNSTKMVKTASSSPATEIQAPCHSSNPSSCCHCPVVMSLITQPFLSLSYSSNRLYFFRTIWNAINVFIYCYLLLILLMRSGDIETNPGPDTPQSVGPMEFFNLAQMIPHTHYYAVGISLGIPYLDLDKILNEKSLNFTNAFLYIFMKWNIMQQPPNTNKREVLATVLQENELGGLSEKLRSGRLLPNITVPDDRQTRTPKVRGAQPLPDQLDQNKCYMMDGNPKGRMFLTNITEGRLGSAKDSQSVKRVFREIGYEIEEHNNLKAKTLKKKLRKFVRLEDHKDMCSTVVMLMGHGSPSGIQCSDGEKVSMAYIINLVSEMKSMTGKPKMIFFQSCRGTKHAAQVETDEAEPDLAVPAKSDILIAYATTDGNVAYRDVNEGSWFIQTLCQVLAEHAHEDDLSSMLEQVTGRVGDKVHREPSRKCRQCVVVEKRGISKKIYFLPKYPVTD